MGKKKRDRTGIVFSTDPEFVFEPDTDQTPDTPEPGEQRLRVTIEKKGRKGKPVCIVSGFVGRHEDLEDLARTLKVNCGLGGTAKNGEIVLQGTMREKVVTVLRNLGFKVS